MVLAPSPFSSASSVFSPFFSFLAPIDSSVSPFSSFSSFLFFPYFAFLSAASFFAFNLAIGFDSGPFDVSPDGFFFSTGTSERGSSLFSSLGASSELLTFSSFLTVSFDFFSFAVLSTLASVGSLSSLLSTLSWPRA